MLAKVLRTSPISCVTVTVLRKSNKTPAQIAYPENVWPIIRSKTVSKVLEILPEHYKYQTMTMIHLKINSFKIRHRLYLPDFETLSVFRWF